MAFFAFKRQHITYYRQMAHSIIYNRFSYVRFELTQQRDEQFMHECLAFFVLQTQNPFISCSNDDRKDVYERQ
jgi:hypothetical protein